MSVLSRRAFVYRTGVASLATGLSGIGLAQESGEKNEKKQTKAGGKKEEVEVTPTEDLMREHGLLNRVLLIYDHCSQRMQSNQQFDVTVLASAAGVIRNFIEQYHEKLEEDHIFPRFEKANKLTDLVSTLRTQHAAGRKVTAQIEELAKGNGLERRGATWQSEATTRGVRAHVPPA